MKKKILLIALMVMLFACVLVISASAAIVRHETDPGLDCTDTAVSTLDYAAFNNSTASDKTSKVVLTDGTYYYVFPAYYVFTTNSNFQPSLTNINSAMKAADSSITADLFTSSKTAFVRIELPTWISNIDQGTGKLEGWTGIKEFRFGTTLRSITAQNAFTGCSNLEYISDISHFTYVGRSSFSSCPKLAVDITWPSAVTSIEAEMFANSGITSIIIPQGVTAIGTTAFKNCDNLTEIICPNSLKSVGKHAFGSCDKLETLSFGAGFNAISRVNEDYETTSGDKKLKYVYLPEGFLTAIAGAKNNDYKHIFNISEAKITFFFTGTQAQAEQIKALMASTNNNPNLGNAEIEQYNPTTDYATYNKNVIVWGYNKCEAFYDGEHKWNESSTLDVDTYIGEFNELRTCSVCLESLKVNKEAYAPIINFLGYSAKVGGDNICAGYSLNTDSLEAYERITGKTLSYGVVAVIPPQSADLAVFEPVNVNGEPLNEFTIMADITGECASFDFIIRGFTSDHYDLALTMCAYVNDGSRVDYLSSSSGVNTQTEYAGTITFNTAL